MGYVNPVGPESCGFVPLVPELMDLASHSCQPNAVVETLGEGKSAEGAGKQCL